MGAYQSCVREFLLPARIIRQHMPLQAGTRLGPYEVLSLIGAGGMGEVYQARDTRLDRKVAVKVLAPELATDAEFRARFAREAKAISALNHPHICGLYDIGREHDTEYLVLELLEGETLAARLERGPLPLAQVLRFGIEIADALEAAHRHGIVHRDLKPGNVMLTAAGTKLLDFGLAKHTVGAAGQALSMLATAPGTGTAQGTIIGTLQYMAPEQVQGAASRCAYRHLRAGRAPVRDGHRPTGVRGHHAGEPDREDSRDRTCPPSRRSRHSRLPRSTTSSRAASRRRLLIAGRRRTT